MKKHLPLLLACLLVPFHCRAQGCVTVRSLTGFGQFSLPQYNEEPVKWLVNVNSRYSEFHETYQGSSKQNVAPEDQTFSSTFIMDFVISRNFENGWSVSVDIPFMYATRQIWQEHYPNPDKIKHTTNSFAMSDIRISGYKWLFDVTKAHRGNVQVGVGLKLPSGDYAYEDFFYTTNEVSSVTSRESHPVNFTLQPGDGGTGVTTEINAFYTLGKSWSIYANAFYLFNPRDMNGTEARNLGRPFNAEEIAAGLNVNSVGDAYTLRSGGNYRLKNFVIWAGVRLEGIPVYDAIGSSNGLRRAGYTVAIEPGIDYNLKKATVFMFVPIVAYGTINQIVPDKELDRPTRGGLAKSVLFLGAVFKL